jgi:hypothetical protein
MSKEIVYWKQRNGELISIDDMDINHLRNVLKMIIRNSQKIQKPKSEVKLNGDIAQSFNNDMDLWDMEMEAGITDIETGIL